MKCDLFIFTISCSNVFAIVKASRNLIVEIKAYDDRIGVYFPGVSIGDHAIFSYTIPEHFLQVIEAKGTGVEAVNFETSLLLRSSDLKKRILMDFHSALPAKSNNNKREGASHRIVETEANTNVDADDVDNDNDTHSYKITFHNLAIGDREGNVPIQLKHSDNSYVWIDGGDMEAYYTNDKHEFIISDINRTPLFSVKLASYDTLGDRYVPTDELIPKPIQSEQQQQQKEKSESLKADTTQVGAPVTRKQRLKGLTISSAASSTTGVTDGGSDSGIFGSIMSFFF